MDITNSMNPSVIDLLGILLRAKNVAVLPNHESFYPTPAEDFAALAFQPYEASVPLSGLVFNETCQNVSLTVVREGRVLIDEDAPRGIPSAVPSFVTRNYSIIRDGELSVSHLPLKASDEVVMILKAFGFNFVDQVGSCVVVKLDNLPKISPTTKTPTSEEFAQKHFRLLEVQAACKVFKHFAGDTEKKEAFEHVYGNNAAKWLAEHGVTANGFSPKRQYKPKGKPSLTLECKVKGAANDLPSVEEAQEKIDQFRQGKLKKLPLGVSLMHHAILQVQAFETSDIYMNPIDRLTDLGEDERAATRAQAQERLFALWARVNFEAADKERRKLLREIGQMTFVVLEKFRTDGSSFSNDRLEPNVGLTIPVKGDQEGIRATITLKVNSK